MPKAPSEKKKATSKSSLEQTLWAAADKLRSHMDAAEYKHVVLGLISVQADNSIGE